MPMPKDVRGTDLPLDYLSILYAARASFPCDKSSCVQRWQTSRGIDYVCSWNFRARLPVEKCCNMPIKRVAVIGLGPGGSIAIDALAQEKAFDTIRVFERREAPGGCW